MWSKRELEENAKHAQARSQRWGEVAGDEINNALHCSCTWMKNNPWASVGVGAALGLVVGMLISKK